MTKKVVLRAPVLSQSGYGVHARQIARWLMGRSDVELSVIPVQWGVTPWYINPKCKDGFIGELMKRSKSDSGPWDLSFQLQLPDEWDPKLATRNVGVTAGVETDVCNPEWIKRSLQMDGVVVPSQFIKSVFERTCAKMENPDVAGLSSRLAVIPESFIDDVLDPNVPALDVDFETSFNFLLVGQLTGHSSNTDRKNIFNTVKWFCETFKDDSDVGLVIKTNNGRETKIDRRVTNDMLSQLLRAVRSGPYPKIHFIHGMLEDKEMAGLYRHPKVKALLTLTRGEGFGLPILEAAASGLPVIATNWSAHTEFLKQGRFVKLDFELKDIHKTRVDKRIFMPGAKWADVVETDVKRKLRKFKDSSDAPKSWADELKPKIQAQYSAEAIKRIYDDTLKGLLT